MADFYPLIANTTAGQIQEIPSTANLNLSGCNVINTGTYYGSGAGLTNLPGGNVSGTVATATTAGTVTTAAQPNITSVGTLSSLTVTANVTGGNLAVGTGNITGGNVTGFANINATTHTGTTVSVTGNITGGNLITAGLLSVNSGNVTGTVIVNAGANGVGNIGSATGYFNTAHVKATSAQYADLAEMYVADAEYTSGTVVEFGGSFEITQTTSACSTAVAGIISTNPSYLMNATQSGKCVLPVALTGRVPCQVLGPVKKGDVLISSGIPGVAQRIGTDWQPGCTVGKAMEDILEAVVQTIEVAVGRL